jgi:carboxylesterase type B
MDYKIDVKSSKNPEIVIVPPTQPQFKSHRTCGCLFLLIVSIVLIAIGIFKSCYSPAKLKEYVYVNTSLGRIEGYVIERSPRPISAFIGIPFADPPTGDRRFKKPYPVTAWKPQTLKATKHKQSCFQFIITHDARGKKSNLTKLLEKVPQGEDCLYLNVFVPGKLIDPKAKKAVMVWIHGGAFLIGNLEYYDPSQLASHGDVIIVAIAYRLGIWGFMHSTHPSEIPGNMGLHDQARALHWIHEHITSFGGDPDRITIFGESAGGISVGFHMISHQSRHLFRRAILQSGSPLTIMAAGIDMGPIYVEKVASLLNCPFTHRKLTGGKYSHFHEKTYECLRNADIDSIREAERKLVTTRQTFGFVPTMDDDFFPDHPLEFFRSEDPFYPNHTDIIMGHTGNEGGSFLHYSLPELFPKNRDLPSNLSYDLIRERIRGLAPNMENQVKMLFEVLHKENVMETPYNIARKFSELVSDMAFVCPNIFMMDSFTRFPGKKVYYYKFDSRPKSADTYSWSKAAVHEEEMQFVFGYPFSKPEKYTKEEQYISQRIMNHWTNFAKFGVPNKDWEPCIGEERHYRLYGTDMKIKDLDGVPDNTCSAFYETVYEQVREKYRFKEL